MSITAFRDVQATSAAHELWQALQKKSVEIWGKSRPLAELIPVPIEVIARSLLGLTLEEPEDLPSDRPGFEVAGLMDRATQRIAVAQKYPYTWRRFTMAHEVAHWVLHPDELYHRDRPLTGGERANVSRPPEEQEADKFASELLMPSEVLTGHFRLAFGDPIDGRAPSSLLVSRLSAISHQKIKIEDFAGDLRRRSLMIANMPLFRAGRYFEPLAKRFEVSRIAMAIHLEDLALVL